MVDLHQFCTYLVFGVFPINYRRHLHVLPRNVCNLYSVGVEAAIV